MSGRLIPCLALLAALPFAAHADDPTARGFDADPVKPALSLDGGFAVESAPCSTSPAGSWSSSKATRPTT
jgi:hypothetical protein